MNQNQINMRLMDKIKSDLNQTDDIQDVTEQN